MMSTTPMLMTQSALVRHAAGRQRHLLQPKSQVLKHGDANAKATFCGSDDVYDANADDTKCAGAACAAGDKDTLLQPKSQVLKHRGR